MGEKKSEILQIEETTTDPYEPLSHEHFLDWARNSEAAKNLDDGALRVLTGFLNGNKDIVKAFDSGLEALRKENEAIVSAEPEKALEKEAGSISSVREQVNKEREEKQKKEEQEKKVLDQKIGGVKEKFFSNSFGHVEEVTPVETINRTGPDFLKHKFTAFLTWNNDTIFFEEYPWLSDYEKKILDKKGFAIRFGSISVPAVRNEEFSIPILETEVRKVASTKEMNNQASFTFRLDENLIWLDKINELSGRKNLIESSSHPYIENDENKRYDEWQKVLKVISKSWSPGKRRLKDHRLNLIIRMDHLHDVINPNVQVENLPYFVFQDIKILGTSDAIAYDRESTSTQEISISFIFKRSFQVTDLDFLKSAV